MRWIRYLWLAFNARPFGMPVPPLWFALSAFALLGYFVDPAFYVIGGGATLSCAALVAANGRFRRAVDAAAQGPVPDDRTMLLDRLDAQSRGRQEKLERQCADLQRVLESAKAGEEHIRGIWRLAELHLRLLTARGSAEAVVASSDNGPDSRLSEQLADVKHRMAQPDIDKDLRDALDEQAKILEQRLAIRAEARRRLQVLDAELDRIGEQMALIREQALMTSDPAAIRRSVDSLSAFLSESGRWLADQHEILGELDVMTQNPFGPGGGAPEQWQRADKRAEVRQ